MDDWESPPSGVTQDDCERLMARLKLTGNESKFMRDGLARQRQWTDRKWNEREIMEFRAKYPARSLWGSIIQPVIGGAAMAAAGVWLGGVKDETQQPHFLMACLIFLVVFLYLGRRNEQEERRHWKADLEDWEK
jgi:hypothetical protein